MKITPPQIPFTQQKNPPSKISDFPRNWEGFPLALTAIWQTLIYKALWSLFVDGMQLQMQQKFLVLIKSISEG